MKTDVSSNDALVCHLGQAVESFAVMMFCQIRDFLEDIASSGAARDRLDGSRHFQYSDFRMVRRDRQDTLIAAEFICLFLSELDVCLFEFRYPEEVRVRMQAVLGRSLALETGIDEGHLGEILSARIQTYSRRLVRSCDALPDADLADDLMLYLLRSLGAGTIPKTGMLYPVFHDLSCLKYAYMRRGYVFHAGLRHYLYRLFKTVDEIVFVDEAIYCDLFHEAVCVARDMLRER